MAGLRETTAAEQQEGAGYLVGDEVCALFAGALTFREQCVAAGILYKDLDSEGDSTTDDGGGKSMMLEDEAEEAEEDGRDVCAHVCSHNDRCEVCDDGGAYYSLATAGGANKIRSSTWVLSDTNRLATVQPHSAVHEQTTSLQPHPKGLLV